jgi:hypothetical protein
MTLEVEAPTLCMMATENRGRCEFKAKPDQSVDGEYFGSGALAFTAPGSPVSIHAAEMRRARLCCFAFRAADADYVAVPISRYHGARTVVCAVFWGCGHVATLLRCHHVRGLGGDRVDDAVAPHRHRDRVAERLMGTPAVADDHP